MYQLFHKITDNDKRPISSEKDTMVECFQLAETLYWIFSTVKEADKFDGSKYGIFKRTEDGDWEEVAHIREDDRDRKDEQ